MRVTTADECVSEYTINMTVKSSAPQTIKRYLKYALYRYRDSDNSEAAYYFAQLAFLLMCVCGDTLAKWRGVFREYDASDCRGSKQQSESVQMTYKQAIAHCKKSVKMIAKDGIDTLLADEHEAFDEADVLEYPLYQQRWMTLRDYPVLYMIYEAADEALAIRTTRLMWQKILLYADMLDAPLEHPAAHLTDAYRACLKYFIILNTVGVLRTYKNDPAVLRDVCVAVSLVVDLLADDEVVNWREISAICDQCAAAFRYSDDITPYRDYLKTLRATYQRAVNAYFDNTYQRKTPRHQGSSS